MLAKFKMSESRVKLPPNGSLCPVSLSAGLLESSMRLKPHEAQSYRKKALWVSWVSIGVTIILAIAAFSEYPSACYHEAHRKSLLPGPSAEGQLCQLL